MDDVYEVARKAKAEMDKHVADVQARSKAQEKANEAIRKEVNKDTTK